jgi:hypothetical protein
MRIQTILGLAALVFLGFAMSGAGDRQAKQAAAKKAEAEIVRVEAPAAGEPISGEYIRQTWNDAQGTCRRALEDSADYGFRGNGWLGYFRPEYTNGYQLDDGHLIFMGDDAQVQDRMGEWKQANYECEWNPAESKVVSTFIGIGKIPKPKSR